MNVGDKVDKVICHLGKKQKVADFIHVIQKSITYCSGCHVSYRDKHLVQYDMKFLEMLPLNIWRDGSN